MTHDTNDTHDARHETPDDAPTDEFPTEWVNYGDVNPEIHGGLWVRYEGSAGFKVVRTNRADMVVPDGDPDFQVVEVSYVDVDDIWREGRPSAGFTDAMLAVLDALGDERHAEAPANPEFVDRIAYYVADMPFHMGDTRTKFVDASDGYDAVLERFGVSRDES